jgi:hypothetical protein
MEAAIEFVPRSTIAVPIFDLTLPISSTAGGDSWIASKLGKSDPRTAPAGRAPSISDILCGVGEAAAIKNNSDPSASVRIAIPPAVHN